MTLTFANHGELYYLITRNVSGHVFSAPGVNADINQRRLSNQICKGEEINAD